MHILEDELFKHYPRVAPTAETHGFQYEDVEILLRKIESDLEASSYFNSGDSRQVALKAIITRIGLKREDFFEYLTKVKTHELPDDILQQDCGRYNLKAYKAILK
ncbi:hypothetical protein KDN24_06580 [Bacillus sp. Bva_UNVM-123]|uniref:hypothetical protein n=1 Tax=Bacillus sp. Bva_UNVM-123 TaxID=2829798 RepID=UPI00391F982D